MMKQQKLILVLIALVFLAGCGPAFNTVDFSSQGLRDDNVDIFKVSINESLLSADQVFASMSEVTGVAPTGAIVTEWNNNARAALADNYKVVSISAPILMAAANLGSHFCDLTLENEVGQAVADRRLYAGIDFSKGLDQLSDSDFDSTVRNMANLLWGRQVGVEELSLFRTYRADFTAELTATEKTQAVRTRHLILGICTAILASYEALSL